MKRLIRKRKKDCYDCVAIKNPTTVKLSIHIDNVLYYYDIFKFKAWAITIKYGHLLAFVVYLIATTITNKSVRAKSHLRPSQLRKLLLHPNLFIIPLYNLPRDSHFPLSLSLRHLLPHSRRPAFRLALDGWLTRSILDLSPNICRKCPSHLNLSHYSLFNYVLHIYLNTLLFSFMWCLSFAWYLQLERKTWRILDWYSKTINLMEIWMLLP